MLMEFKLDMPNVGSWNGRWTGEKEYHARVINFTQKYGSSKNALEKADKILKGSSYYYNFGDGWGMDISVRVVDSKEAAKIRKKSAGFCSYDWAIDSILQYGEILNSAQRKVKEAE